MVEYFTSSKRWPRPMNSFLNAPCIMELEGHFGLPQGRRIDKWWT
jgi:hypothetical protein